jgi:membrane fusion protein (multidrug efflux system)
MKPGQPATVYLDAYPGVEINGHVASIAAGTGSEFSILPAQNATGNWVKVVQRVPVRVALDRVRADVPLRAGLSASVEVDTGVTGRGGTLLSSIVSEAQAR